MFKTEEKTRKILGVWFDVFRRDLPWRSTKDPYKIWLSEVILQQTRVAQGMPYYQRFIAAFPDVNSLAGASENEVLRLWQGLGYYSRARNLHHAAKEIQKIFNGVFPDTYNELISLKGIGKYTASAIISMAFNKPFPVLDGNVYRVLSRLYGIETPINSAGAEKIFMEKATNLLDKDNPGKFNEAMMEFGALQCVPQNPDCAICPLNLVCIAFQVGKVDMLPIKIPKKAPVLRSISYALIHDSHGLYMKQRTNADIWQNLYDMPEIINGADEVGSSAILSVFETSMDKLNKIASLKHQLTHQSLRIEIYELNLKKPLINSVEGHIYIKYEDLNKYPLPRPIEIFLKNYMNIKI